MMLPLEEIRSRLERMCIARAARQTGIHYNIVYRIAKGATANPSYATVKALSDYLGDGEK